jgi:hypothetical protein
VQVQVLGSGKSRAEPNVAWLSGAFRFRVGPRQDSGAAAPAFLQNLGFDLRPTGKWFAWLFASWFAWLFARLFASDLSQTASMVSEMVCV